jgi:glycogen debranching enzyme
VTELELREAARSLLLRNVKDGYSALLGQHYCYVAPAPKPYPFQWFWDTCFHVVMLARLGEFDLAQRNLRSLFAMQEENGFVGHMIFWKQVLPLRRTDVMQARPSWESLRPHMSALIQPPLAATALHTLFESCGDRVYLGEMYAHVRRHHDWLAQNRDFDGDGLLTIISPFESGMDWKPSYDPVLGYTARTTKQRLALSPLYWKGVGVDLANFMRGYDLKRIHERGRFLVKDAGFNAIYAMDLECMERLAPIVGDDPAVFASRRRRLIDSMLRLMYDAKDAAFYDLQEPGSRKIRIRTPTIFFPLAIPEIDPRVASGILAAHFDRAEEFAAPFPLPSVALDDPAFCRGETKLIWRGGTWAFINWFLFHALHKRGFEERAQRLRRALWRAIEKSGFREYYDPLDGEGHGAREFTWSCLALDMAGPAFGGVQPERPRASRHPMHVR